MMHIQSGLLPVGRYPALLSKSARLISET